MSDSYDVIVIGGGPAGYPCAIRAGQLGLKVACIDAWVNRDGNHAFGGTCLNAGCIPSKALLESSELYHRAQHEFEAHGIGTGKLSLDLARMQSRKQAVSNQLTGGIKTLFKANGVEGLAGWGSLAGGGKVTFKPLDDGEERTLTAKSIVIATGSEPVELKQVAPFDGDRVVDSWGALDFESVPESIGVIGAGVIGVELGSVWARLGAKVTLLEAMDTFLPMVDQQVAKDALRQFGKQGLNIRLGAKVTAAQVSKKDVKLSFQAGDKEETLTVDRLIVAVGRRPYTDKLGAKEAGLKLDERGFVVVDKHYRSNLDNVYAVGDVIGGPMLAHKAIEEGVVLAEQLAGHKGVAVNYNAVPSVVYTAPEIAWVGLSEAQAKEQGFEVKVGSAPFAANGRAKAMEQASGIVKVISDTKTDRILGVHMSGPYVSELLAEAVLALEYAATTEDVALTMHGHPTLSETLHEAVLSVDGLAIHAVNKNRKK
jgi:dihydrolipoamide dehydrogenase